MSGTKPPPESQLNDLGALSKTLTEVKRGHGKYTEFFVNQNSKNELSDANAKPHFLKTPHKAINAYGGAAVSCLGNGWSDGGYPTSFEYEEDVVEGKEMTFIEYLAICRGDDRTPWEE